MTRVLIVGCGAAKLDRAAPARELYTGSLARAARRHAEASGLPWRILSSEYGLVLPDQVIGPYDRHMRSRMPPPFGPPWAVERNVLQWGRTDGGGRRWVDTGLTERVRDWRTPWWWSGLRAALHQWLFAPTMAGRWQPADALNVDRDEPVSIEVHAGSVYVAAMAEAAKDFSNINTEAPLAGLTLGKRLQWYAARRSDEQLAG